jgi:hypothetical protein
MGKFAGLTSQSENAVAIGPSAGQTSQGISAVAIGQEAGKTSQKPNAVAIGERAGFTSQGNDAVAIGQFAGQSNQSINAIAIGRSAGETGQSISAVAIGPFAGQTTQGCNAVAMGLLAGFTSQGISAVAVGHRAGFNRQGANSIVLNASGADLDGETPSAFYVKPVRNIGANLNSTVLTYDTGTFEIGIGTKTFVIQHPLEPAKYLVHACLEGPEAGVYYRGTAYIPEKVIEIELPLYADALATEFTVHVTPILQDDDYDLIPTVAASRVKQGKFKVYSTIPCIVDYVVFGKRCPVEIEPLKSAVHVKGDGPYKWI